MSSLHPRQEHLLQLLRENIHNPLTIKDLSKELDAAPGVLYHHLAQLEKKGLLKRNPNNPKDYMVLDVAEKPVAYINKYGLAQCGPNGSILDGTPVDKVAIPTQWIKFPASEAFIVEARGNSMAPKIQNGDIIIARKQNTANDGDIVVCVYKEEARIKQFYRRDGVVALVSLNMAFPMEVVTEDLRIEGIVKNIHSFK